MCARRGGHANVKNTVTISRSEHDALQRRLLLVVVLAIFRQQRSISHHRRDNVMATRGTSTERAAFDDSFAAEVARALRAGFYGHAAAGSDASHHAARRAGGGGRVLHPCQVFLSGEMGDFVPGDFPNDADSDHLAEFVAIGSAASNPAQWRDVPHEWGILLQHDMQLLARTAANSAAVARWFESLAASMRDWKPSQPH